MLGSWPAFSSMLQKRSLVGAKSESSDQKFESCPALDYVSTDRKVHGTDGAAVAHDSDGLTWKARVLDRIAAEIHYARGVRCKRVLLSDRGSRIGKDGVARQED